MAVLNTNDRYHLALTRPFRAVFEHREEHDWEETRGAGVWCAGGRAPDSRFRKRAGVLW